MSPERKGLTVTFPDGTVFSSDRDCQNQTEVWVKSIKKLLAQFGSICFMAADLKSRKSGSKERFMSTDPTLKNTATRQKISTKRMARHITYFTIITPDRKRNILTVYPTR